MTRLGSRRPGVATRFKPAVLWAARVLASGYQVSELQQVPGLPNNYPKVQARQREPAGQRRLGHCGVRPVLHARLLKQAFQVGNAGFGRV